MATKSTKPTAADGALAARTTAALPTAPRTPQKRGCTGIEIALPPGMSKDRLLANVAVDGYLVNARTLAEFGAGTFSELELVDCTHALQASARAVHGGDLSAAESLLMSQAVALNMIFGELARRSAVNMGEHFDAHERYMRLALKAQGQCRATLETLAAIKNPPVLFAKQANINNGGQQQVNNGTASASGTPVMPHASEPQTQSRPNELLEDQSHDNRMDTGATRAAGRADSHLAPVGAVDGAAHSRGKGTEQHERGPRRTAAGDAQPSARHSRRAR